MDNSQMDLQDRLRLSIPASARSSVRESVLQYRANKIGWLGSRLDEDTIQKLKDDADSFSLKPGLSDILIDERPKFKKRSSSSILELFYDLWVVATLNVFTSAHEITSRSELNSFIEFIFLLLTTWFLVAIYDVRFLEDSVVERITRAFHLGVLLAFVQSTPFFDPEKQSHGVLASLSLALAFSRLMLAIQYGIVIWQTRHFTQGRNDLAAALAIHVVAGGVYACLAAALFVQETTRLPYRAWLVVATIEIVVNLVASIFSKVISFEGSHLPERLNQLTLVVLGEGVINLARDLTSIERNSEAGPRPWSPQMILIFLSGLAIVYLIFQIYFDWMHHNGMASWRQIAWALLHPPFHFALLLVMEAINQFIIWWRLLEIIRQSSADIFHVMSSFSSVPTSSEVASKLNDTVQAYLDIYPAQSNESLITQGVSELLHNVSSLPPALWQTLVSEQANDFAATSVGGLSVSSSVEELASLAQFQNDLLGLFSAVMDSVFSNFGLDPFEDFTRSSADAIEAEKQAFAFTTSIFNFTFVYGFLAAGGMVILLVLLHAVSKRHGWTPFNILRSGIIVLLGMALMLITLLSTDLVALKSFFETPWPLPTMAITFVIVLVLTHVPHPKVFLGYEAPVEDSPTEAIQLGWPTYYNSTIPRSRVFQAGA